MRLERKRTNLLTLTATSQELSALVAAARMALEAMRSRPSAVPADALELLERVLADYDRGCARLGDAAADSRGAKSASGASGSLSD